MVGPSNKETTIGLLDQILGAATGGGGASGVTGAMGGGGAPAGPAPQSALKAVVDLLHSPQVGGIGGLMRLFQSNGLGHVADGWVQQGPNPPVSAGQVSQVFGQERLGQFASQLGVPQAQAPGLLAQLLPHVVDHMTPTGQVPAHAPDGAAGVFDLLKSKLLG